MTSDEIASAAWDTLLENAQHKCLFAHLPTPDRDWASDRVEVLRSHVWTVLDMAVASEAYQTFDRPVIVVLDESLLFNHGWLTSQSQSWRPAATDEDAHRCFCERETLEKFLSQFDRRMAEAVRDAPEGVMVFIAADGHCEVFVARRRGADGGEASA